MRLFLILAATLALGWVFLAVVFGRRAANIIILLGGGVSLVVALGDLLHFNLAWILFTAWTLFVVVIGLSSVGNRKAWQTFMAILALTGLGGVGILGSALGYSAGKIAAGEGMVLLAFIIASAVMGFQERR